MRGISQVMVEATIFSSARIRAAQEDWHAMARFVVGAFRADAARAGAVAEIAQFVKEMSAQNPEFKEMWLANDVHAYGEGMKRLHHPELGVLDMEFSAFAVDGRPDLGMVVYNPATSGDAERIRGYLGSRALSG